MEQVFKLFRFGVSGLVSTFAYFFIAIALSNLGTNSPVTNSVIAYLCCIALSFVLQRQFAFRANGKLRSELPRFVTTSLAGLLLSTLIVGLVVEGFHQSPTAGYAVVVLVVPAFSFLMFDRFVFRHAPPDGSETVD